MDKALQQLAASVSNGKVTFHSIAAMLPCREREVTHHMPEVRPGQTSSQGGEDIHTDGAQQCCVHTVYDKVCIVI